jgi:hypothetical protein
MLIPTLNSILYANFISITKRRVFLFKDNYKEFRAYIKLSLYLLYIYYFFFILFEYAYLHFIIFSYYFLFYLFTVSLIR